MIKKFKLIKEYPDSPTKGTEFTFKEDTDGFFFGGILLVRYIRMI